MRQPNPRVFQQINKQMDRSSDPLRRQRPMEGSRIGKPGDMPKGPRGNNPNFRQQQQNGGQRGGRPPTSTLNNMNPHQRMQVFNNFDQQRGFQPMMGPNGPIFPGGPPFQPMVPGGPPGPGGFMNGMPPFVPGPNGAPFNPAFNNGGFYPNNGRPHHQQQRNFNPQHNRNNGPSGQRNMFDMVEFPNRPPHQQQQGPGQQPPKEADDSQMEEDEAQNPADVPCRFGQRCGKADCPFAHPTPAAPPNRQVAISGEKCPFGVKCKNTKVYL